MNAAIRWFKRKGGERQSRWLQRAELKLNAILLLHVLEQLELGTGKLEQMMNLNKTMMMMRQDAGFPR